MTSLPELIYAGPIPERPVDYYRLTAGRGHACGFIYLLSRAAHAIYVGISWNPGRRFDRHRTRDWWSSADTLLIYAISGQNRREVRRALLAQELDAIRTLRPSANIAGVE